MGEAASPGVSVIKTSETHVNKQGHNANNTETEFEPGLAAEDQPFNDSALLHQRNVIVLLHSFHFLFNLLPLADDRRNFHILSMEKSFRVIYEVT